MKIVFALLMILCVNMFLFLTQMTIDEINPGGQVKFFNPSGTLLSQVDNGNYTLPENVSGEFPQPDAQVSTDNTGDIFTDTFRAFRQWFLDNTGISWLLGILNALYNFLVAIGVPTPIAWAIGAMWHLTTLFLIILVAGGRI